MMTPHSFRVLLRSVTAGIALLSLCGVSHAHLGGFELQDGYQPFLNRVEEYNAGQYGPNSGYVPDPGFTPITINTGLWELLSGGGSSPGATSYATGHQWYDRTWVNSGNTLGSGTDHGLVITTNHEGWDGPSLMYRYSLDTQDLGGAVSPTTADPTTIISTTSDTIINVSFWWCAQLAGPELGGEIPEGYFGNEIAFLDSNGNTGFMLGLTQRGANDTVTYWDGSSMFESSIVAASNRYDRWDITLDLIDKTVSADYYQFSTGTLFNLVSDADMMFDMDDFTHMTFRTSPGVNNAKLMSLDDFRFHVVPEPGSLALLGVGVMLLVMRRGRGRRP